MLLLGHNLWPRFFYFSAACALLVVIEGAMAVSRLAPQLIRPLRGRHDLVPAIGTMLCAVIILASAITVPRCYALPKQDYIAARDFAESRRGPDEAVIAVGLAARVYGAYYAPNWPEARTAGELKELRNRHKSLLLVYTLPYELEAFNAPLWKAIQSGFEKVAVFPGTLGGGEVYVCRNR